MRWAWPARTSRCFVPVLVEARVAGGLVGRADDLDRGHQPILAAPQLADLEERLGVLLGLDRLRR